VARTITGARVALAVSLAVAAAAALCLAACGGSEETDPAALDGTEWRLERWSESGIDPAAFIITAVFSEGMVGGTSGVNSYSGSYTTGPGDDFETGELASTMMAGPEPAMEAEAVYLRLLDEAASFAQTDDTLTLFDADGTESLVFTAGAGE